jgi:hypothetical protein
VISNHAQAQAMLKIGTGTTAIDLCFDRLSNHREIKINVKKTSICLNKKDSNQIKVVASL